MSLVKQTILRDELISALLLFRIMKEIQMSISSIINAQKVTYIGDSQVTPH